MELVSIRTWAYSNGHIPDPAKRSVNDSGAFLRTLKKVFSRDGQITDRYSYLVRSAHPGCLFDVRVVSLTSRFGMVTSNIRTLETRKLPALYKQDSVMVRRSV